jgi:predicted phosphodiesterase
MRYAIVSDLHANIRAWDSVLADLRAQSADVVICLGDVVGYGPNPSEVLKGVREVATNLVMGNHDAAAVGMMDYSIFNEHAQQAIEWTMTKLDAEAKAFLSSVPLAIEAGEVLFVHAEVCEPGRFGYITDTAIAKENFEACEHFVIFVGHTHSPKIFEQDENGIVTEHADSNTRLEEGKRYIVNVGSVGEPRDADDLRARYVIYDSGTREVVFRRVEFDILSYRNDLDATSLAFRPFFLCVYEHDVEGREVIKTEPQPLPVENTPSSEKKTAMVPEMGPPEPALFWKRSGDDP